MLKDLNNDTHIIILPAHNIHVLVFFVLLFKYRGLLESIRENPYVHIFTK